jgi:hypothetical protein
MKTSLKVDERSELQELTAALSRYAVRVVDRRGGFKNISGNSRFLLAASRRPLIPGIPNIYVKQYISFYSYGLLASPSFVIA